MAKTTTVKAIALRYGDVGNLSPSTPLMGVLKGLVVNQDDPDSTQVEAEFYDSPFDIFYESRSVTMTFELANYDLSELPALFGGEVGDDGNYEGAANAFTSEHAWELEFQRGYKSLYIYRGLTVGTVKKDEDGALNYSVTITALTYNNGTDDHMYGIRRAISPYTGHVLSSTPSLPSEAPVTFTFIDAFDWSILSPDDMRFGKVLVSSVGSSERNWVELKIVSNGSTIQCSSQDGKITGAGLHLANDQFTIQSSENYVIHALDTSLYGTGGQIISVSQKMPWLYNDETPTVSFKIEDANRIRNQQVGDVIGTLTMYDSSSHGGSTGDITITNIGSNISATAYISSLSMSMEVNISDDGTCTVAPTVRPSSDIYLTSIKIN